MSTTHDRKRWILIGLAMAVGIPAAVAGTDVALDALKQRPATERGTVIVPDRYLRRWDPITVFFDGEVGPRGGGAEVDPTRHVKLDPDQPGAWTWLDRRTLQFRPAEPWPPLARYRVKADDKNATLSTLMAPPQRTVPHDGASGLSPVDSITLEFRDPMAADVLARIISVELRELPGIGDAPAQRLSAEDFEVKTLERANARASASYVLRLRQPIPLGMRATVRLRLAADAPDDDSIGQLTFTTAEPFRVTSFGCAAEQVPASHKGAIYPTDQALRCTGAMNARVDFSAAPQAVSVIEGRNLVRFEPTVANLEFKLQGTTLVVDGAFQREVRYRMILVPVALADRNGRPLQLEANNAASIWFPPQNPYLRWNTGHGIAEQHGPRRVPMAGRGHGKADLRIYRVDPLNRSFWPFPESPVNLDEADRPPGPGEEPEPWTSTSNIAGGQLHERLRALGSPGVSTLVDLPLKGEGSAATFGLDIGSHLDRLAGERKPGHYLVGLRRLDGSTERSWVRLQVTDLSLSTLEEIDRVRFIVTSLKSGEPLAGATIELQGTKSEGRTTVWATLMKGTSDRNGVYEWPAPGRTPGTTVQRVVVRKGADTLVLDPSRPPDAFANGHWRSDSSRWLQWAWGDLEGRAEKPERLCHVFTERPVYRPEEKVHIKGYVRDRHQGRLHPISGKGVVTVVAPSGAEWRFPQTLSGSGSFYALFDEADIPTGTYRAIYRGHDRGSCDVHFEVEAYRLPRFEVRLHGPDDAPSDRPFEVRATAVYYAGGQVINRPVRWRVSQFPYTWSPVQKPGFVYSSDARFSGGQRFVATPSLTSAAKTDKRGEARLTLDPSIEPTAHPRTYSVEATVTGVDGQTVTTTRRFNVAPAFVVGLKAPRFLEKAEVIRPEIVVVGPTGKLVEGQKLTVRLKHRQWHSALQASDFSDGVAKYVTDVVDAEVRQMKVVSAKEPTVVDLPIERAGVYVVEVEAYDQLGRAQLVSVDLYAGGAEALSWTKPKAGVFELSASADAYQPGQTANILIRSPYQEARALVIVETPRGNRYSQVAVRKGKATFSLPIETGWVPRLPVHVILMRGRVGDRVVGGTTALDLGKPTTVASTLWLTVESVENIVNVALAHPERSLPGKKVRIDIALTDYRKKPVSGEVTLWLVDQAVLALGTEQRLDPLPDFIRARRSYLSVHDTRNLAFGRVPFSRMPGGDEGEREAASPLDKATVRRNFQPVPYYHPAILVGASGKTSVEVQLPDNLTIFKIRAKVASGAERFGIGKGQIAVRLPVLVQPALPRFVRPGDRFAATGIGRIVEGKGGKGKAEIRVDGLRLKDKAVRALSWNAEEPERIAYWVEVPTPKIRDDGSMDRDEVEVTLGVSRGYDGAADAFASKLPIRPDRRLTVERAVATLKPGAPWKLDGIEDDLRPGSFKRSVVVSDAVGIVRMAAALDSIRRAPEYSTLTRLRRARVFLGTVRLRDELGMSAGKESLDRVVNATLAYLEEVLDPNGHVANWPGSTGSVSLTAEALQFLVEAKEAGYRVDPGLESGMSRTLSRALRSDYRYFLSGESWFERTTALEALSQAGKFEKAYFSELARRADYLDNEGVARVVLAGARGGQTQSAVLSDLEGRLVNGITLRLFQGKEIYAGLKERRTDRNPLILPSETRTLAEMTRALSRIESETNRLPKMVDALVGLAGDDGWGNTEADAAALLALVQRLEKTEAPASRVSLSVGGATQRLTFSGSDPVVRAPITTTDAVSVTLDSGVKEAVVLAHTQYLLAADGSQVAPTAKGFVVERSLLHVQPGGAPPKRHSLERAGSTLTFETGAVIEEHLRVVNPKQRYYVAITIPLAAGFEPLNPNLATAPPEARPANVLTRSPSYVAFLDDGVTYYYDSLPKGTYDFYFRSRANVPGTFVQPAAHAELIYDPSVHGNSAGARIEIALEKE